MDPTAMGLLREISRLADELEADVVTGKLVVDDRFAQLALKLAALLEGIAALPDQQKG